MDRGTKIYAGFLLAVALAFLIWALYEDPQVSALNDRLAGDAELASYSYRFRVIRVENRTAIMTTPRSSRVPVARILGILHPAAAGRATDSTAFQEAQLKLAARQKRAKALVVQQPAIDAVRWELDRRWLQAHGITSDR